MKKTLLATAILGLFSSVASAQSSVTIYGVLDLAVSRFNRGTSVLNALPVSLNGQPGMWNLRPITSNRIGFRGSEDMGGGLKANFSLEHRIDTSQGTEQNGQNGFWRGHSWVGLSQARFGEVRLGRQYNPALYVAQNGDAFGWAYSVGSLQAFNRGGNGMTYSANAITYITPTMMGGLVAQVQVGAGEGGTAVAVQNNPGRTVGANVTYIRGPLYLGAAFNDTDVITPGGQKNRFYTLTAHYNFGFIRPIVNFSRGQNVSTEWTTAYAIGATAPLGAGVLKATYGYMNPPSVANTTAGTPGTTKKFGLGYEYFLSKRTSLHAAVGTGKTENLSRTNGFEAGLKHTF